MSNVSKRGFASMTPERLKEVTSKGGKSVQEKGTGHRFDTDSGKVAGKKGRAIQLEAR